MNNHSLSDQDLALLERTRRTASRHLDVPPTPRDTLAVLRQAAEQQNEKPARSFAWWARPAFAALLLGAVLAGILVRQTARQDTASAVAEAASESEPLDPGIDLAAWNVEIDALMSEVDASLDQLADGDSELNAIAQGLFSMEESSL